VPILLNKPNFPRGAADPVHCAKQQGSRSEAIRRLEPTDAAKRT